MVTVADPPRLTPGLVGRIMAGMAGGLAGGVGFGILMHMTGTIPLVAQLVERDSLVVGWAVHMSIAVFVGTTYALIFGLFSVGLPISTLLGAFYGLVWWVLGGLTLMPLRLGMGLFAFDTAAWQSLAGHLGYGLALGVGYAAVSHLLPNADAPGATGAADGGYAAGVGALMPGEVPPLELSAAPAPPPAQGSILEFILGAEPPPAPPAPPAPARGAGLTPLSPEARALRQHPEPSPWHQDGRVGY